MLYVTRIRLLRIDFYQQLYVPTKLLLLLLHINVVAQTHSCATNQTRDSCAEQLASTVVIATLS